MNKLQVWNFIVITFLTEDPLKKRSGIDWIRYRQAQRLLGENFIGPLEVEQACPFLRYNPRAIKALLKTLPSQERLLEIKRSGSILIVGTPNKMNILKMMNLFPNFFIRQSHSYKEIADFTFSHSEFVESEWLIINQEPFTIPKKISHEQQVSIARSLPTAVELSWAIIIQNIVNGKKQRSISMKTSSSDTLFGCACLGVIAGIIHFFSYNKTGRNDAFKVFQKFAS